MGTHADKHAAGGAGLTLALVSAAAFGTSGTFAAALIGAGWSPGAAVLARIAVAALILTAPAVLRLRGQWTLLRRSAGRVAAYGLLAVAGAQWCYFNAVARIPVGVAILLEYLGVVLVVGWLWLRHGQRPRRLTIIGGVVAIAGLAMVLNLAGTAGINPAGVLWALGGAVGLATFFVLSAGGDCFTVGVLPTPGIALLTRALDAQGGVVLSASHNPFEDNGIKLFSSKGTKFPDAWEDQIEVRLKAADAAPRARGASIGRYAEKRPLEAPEKDYAVAIPRPSNATWGVGQGLDRATGDSDF